MFYNIIVVFIVIISVLLTIVVLLQSGQGQGLTGVAATGMADNTGLGARRTADLLSKATSIFGGTFLVLCVLANFAIDKESGPSRSVLQDGATPAPIEDLNTPAQSPAAVPQQQEQPQSGGDDSGENNPGEQN